MMLKELPCDAPVYTYPPNIQKAIHLLAGIVSRIHGNPLDMKPKSSLIKPVSDKDLNEETHDEE